MSETRSCASTILYHAINYAVYFFDIHAILYNRIIRMASALVRKLPFVYFVYVTSFIVDVTAFREREVLNLFIYVFTILDLLCYKRYTIKYLFLMLYVLYRRAVYLL